MSFEEIVVAGTLKPDGTLELDEKPNLTPGRVQVALAPLHELPPDDPFWQRMRTIWEGQKTRGFVPRTAAEVEAERRQVREEWEERMRRIERTRAEAEAIRTAREQGACLGVIICEVCTQDPPTTDRSPHQEQRRSCMKPLEMVLTELRRLGYDARRIHTFPGTNAAGDTHHVYFIGRPNDRHDVIVREAPDGACRFYPPLRNSNDPASQAGALAEWLKRNATPFITNQLTIRGEPSQLERLLSRVEAHLRDGWKRDRDAEKRRGSNGERNPWDYCFSCTATAERPAAAFWIHARNPNELYISKVVPLEKDELDKAEEYRLLAEFQRDFLDPAAAEVGARTELVQHKQNLEDVLSSEALQRLRAFSSWENHDRLHPSDHRRWHDFLIRAHQDGTFFDSRLLDEWLQEENWPADLRRQLVSEYEASRSLLSVYDEETEGR